MDEITKKLEEIIKISQEINREYEQLVWQSEIDSDPDLVAVLDLIEDMVADYIDKGV